MAVVQLSGYPTRKITIVEKVSTQRPAQVSSYKEARLRFRNQLVALAVDISQRLIMS